MDDGGRLLGEYEAVARRCRRGCSCWPVLYRVMDGGGSRIGGPRRIRRGFCPCSLASKADGGSTLGGSVGSVGILIIMHIYWCPSCSWNEECYKLLKKRSQQVRTIFFMLLSSKNWYDIHNSCIIEGIQSLLLNGCSDGRFSLRMLSVSEIWEIMSFLPCHRLNIDIHWKRLQYYTEMIQYVA